MGRVRTLHRLLGLKEGRTCLESMLAGKGNQKPMMGDLEKRGAGR